MIMFTFTIDEDPSSINLSKAVKMKITWLDDSDLTQIRPLYPMLISY